MRPCKALAAALLMLSTAPALADYITVVSFGGATREAQRKAFYGPFKEHAGVAVVNGSYDGNLDKLKRMQAMDDVRWDVLEVEAPELARGCAEGLFETLPADLAGPPGTLIAGAQQPCGVGIFVWSMVLAYDAGHLATAPRHWADFWDVQRFPGKRGLRRGAKYNLEFALLADGVPAAQVYPLLASEAGVERAFRKLDQIKPYVHWWQSGQEPLRGLSDGSLVMSAAYNGRVSAAQDQGAPLGISWAGSIYDFDFWAIPTRAYKRQQAQDFIRFSSTAAAQQAFAGLISYGPVNRAAQAALPEQQAQRLPTAEGNAAAALAMDVGFWSERGAELEQRFDAWLGTR